MNNFSERLAWIFVLNAVFTLASVVVFRHTQTYFVLFLCFHFGSYAAASILTLFFHFSNEAKVRSMYIASLSGFTLLSVGCLSVLLFLKTVGIYPVIEPQPMKVLAFYLLVVLLFKWIHSSAVAKEDNTGNSFVSCTGVIGFYRWIDYVFGIAVLPLTTVAFLNIKNVQVADVWTSNVFTAIYLLPAFYTLYVLATRPNRDA